MGFDALCGRSTRCRGPIAVPSDPPLAGWRPADWVAGCAVIPRIPLSSSVADIALRAFLDHPIVLYGHHEDLAGGPRAAGEAAAAVNRLGDVQWMSMGDIAASNGERRLAGDGAVVRPYARRLRLAAEPGARTLRVQAPADALDGGSLEGWSVGDGPLQPFGAGCPVRRATATSRSACAARRTSTRATSPRRPGARGRSCAARPPRRATASAAALLSAAQRLRSLAPRAGRGPRRPLRRGPVR